MTSKSVQGLTFGFDIGVASVGWAMLTPEHIVALGVRAFDKAENEKGEPLNLNRREKRTARTRLARRALRMKKLRRMLRDAGLAASADTSAFEASQPRDAQDPWQLRAAALDRLLTPEEWTRVLYHLVKRRGFYAARKSEETDEKSEGGKLSKGVASTSNLLKTKAWRTLGEMAARDEAFAQAKRNKQGDYKNSFSRILLRDELKQLFDAQRELGNGFTSKALFEQVDKLFWTQKPALSGDAMLNLIGKCTFEPNEFRAAKRTWTAERFVWLTKLNNLRISHNGDYRGLSEAERQIALPLPYSPTPLSYKQLRKALGLAEEAKFAGLSYPRLSDPKGKDPEAANLIEIKGWHELRKALNRAGLESTWQRISQQTALLDQIATHLTILKTDDELKVGLASSGLNEAEITALLSVSFTDFVSLSLKALGAIVPLMETGQRYDEACTALNYRPPTPETRSRTLPPLFRIETRTIRNKKKVVRIPFVPNPVVARSLNQARSVMNELIRRHGSPVAVHIELARDLSKPLRERQEIKKGQENFQKERADAVAHFKGNFDGRDPRPKEQDLLKYRLYREQEGQCAYSQQMIDLGRLLEGGYVEIDHILPRSRSFDDSQNNKVLVLAAQNRNKGRQTPFEYMDGASESVQWRNFEAWVRGHKNLRKPKRDRLLRKNFDEREAREFAERNLNDTRYATRYFAQFVRENLQFAEGAGEVPVLTPSGSFISFLRARWGLMKDREQSDLHHALDACVIAAASPALIKRVSDFHRRDELAHLSDGTFVDNATGEILSAEQAAELGARFPKPWEWFREEVLARLAANPVEEIKLRCLSSYDTAQLEALKPVWVSRAPKRRNGGPLHQETIRSAKQLMQGQSAVRVSLQNLKPGDLEDIVGAHDGRNAGLIAALTERFKTFGADGKKAFAQPLYKPLIDGSPGPLVRSVKLLSTQKGGVAIRGGIADQASMWRVDVFEKAGKFYLVPIYQSDRGRKDLPIRAALAHVPREQWTLLDGSYQFRFALSMNDPIRLQKKGQIILGYFAGMDVASANISIWSHDRNILEGKDGLHRGLGVKSVLAFDKLHVDLLGNLYPARPEKRRGLA